MAERRRARNDGKSGGRRWWWLALPLLGVAAYAAFDATLRLVVPREEPAQVAPPQTAAVHPPDAAAAPSASSDPAVARGAQVAIDAAPVAAEPSPTPTAARLAAEAAGTDQSKGKSKAPAPKEHLTGEDKRALEQVLERATGQKSR